MVVFIHSGFAPLICLGRLTCLPQPPVTSQQKGNDLYFCVLLHQYVLASFVIEAAACVDSVEKRIL